jgi:hypothetical protein
MKLPVGSGQVESAVRRVVNLRFKAPGSFWKEATVNGGLSSNGTKTYAKDIEAC